jgi:hypothetical protein
MRNLGAGKCWCSLRWQCQCYDGCSCVADTCANCACITFESLLVHSFWAMGIDTWLHCRH